MSPYDRDLDKNPANFQPLSPLTFLERSARVFPDRTAVIDGARLPTATSTPAPAVSPQRSPGAASGAATRWP